MKYLLGFSLGLIIVISSMFAGYVIRDKNIVTSKPSVPVQLDSFKIYNLINDYRAKNNLPRLSWNPIICEFADIRLQQMHTDFSHNGYDPQYQKFYNPSYTGENLVKGSYSEQDAVNSWIDSSEHLVNIVNPHFTQTCITSDSQYAVQEFSSTF